MDISEKMLEQARLKAERQEIKNIQFLEQDLLKNPLEQEFDLIVVCRVLHHMPDLDAALTVSSTSEGRWTTPHCRFYQDGDQSSWI